MLHEKEENEHFNLKDALEKIYELFENLEDFQENVSEYLRGAIGTKVGGKNLSQRLSDVEERMKTFTDHVNLLTNALNKLSGLQSTEKEGVQQALKEFKEESTKKFSEIQSHAADTIEKSKDIHEAVTSSVGLQSYVFYSVIFLSQLILLGIFIMYKKNAEYSRKLL